jgi:hypothetical protein
MKEYREAEVEFHAFLTLALCHFTSEETAPVSIEQEAEMPQNSSGHFGEEKK